MGVTASAPAKVILFGEHFVVYDKPAVVTAIDLRAQATVDFMPTEHILINSFDLGASGVFIDGRFDTKHGDPTIRHKLEPIRIIVQQFLEESRIQTGIRVNIRSSIPIAAGLGSSAAIFVATAAAMNQLVNAGRSNEDIYQVAYRAESFVHGTSSGVDPAVSTFGGTFLYQKDRNFIPVRVKGDLPLIVGNTGVPRSTGDMVSTVRQIREKYPSIVNPIIESGEQIVLASVEALKNGDLPTIGELMNINHLLLNVLGVSNRSIERLINGAREAGALGAKLTGAGGGGCIIALSLPEKLPQVLNVIRQLDGTAFRVRQTQEGVKVED